MKMTIDIDDEAVIMILKLKDFDKNEVENSFTG